jgi:signal transduction histidine kinase/class 3 adenylate cyclase
MKRLLNKLNIRHSTKIGLYTAWLSIPAWILLFCLVLVFSVVFGTEIAWADYGLNYLAIPLMIVLVSTVLITLNQYIRIVKPKFLSYFLLAIHSIWATYVDVVTLPSEFNSFVMLINFLIGLGFLSPIAGFVKSVLMSLVLLALPPFYIYYFKIPVQGDEKAMIIFYIVGGLVIGVINHYSQKFRLELKKRLVETEEKSKAITRAEESDKQRAVLEELDKEKTTFFQNISHEFRTPLTLIMSPLKEIQRELGDNELVAIALRNANRLYRLVNQLLDYQKLSSGRKQVKLVPVNLGEFVVSISEHFKDFVKKKNINFTCEILPKEDVFIMGGVDSLEKILFNYLSNAYKFTQDDGDITIRLRKLNEHRVRVSVRDSGIGISEENQKRLFQVFSQVEDYASAQVEGSGLGLALVKEIAETLNGVADVRSTEGEGSTFFVEFPIHKMNRRASDGATVVPLPDGLDLEDYQPPPAELSDYQPKDWHLVEGSATAVEEDEGDAEIVYTSELILIIDDLKDMRDLLSKTFRRHGYRTITAADGADGIEKATKLTPSLVVVDWVMPLKSGVEVVEEMKDIENLQGVPTILLTAKTDEESKLYGKQVGASAYLGKPFDEIELMSTANNLLDLKRKELEVQKLNRDLSENVLKRFLPPALVDSIVKGEEKIDDSFKSSVVTALFVNVCSFTKISEQIGPQGIARLLNTYLTEMCEVIFEHEGTIDKIVGDEIMVIWGAPVSVDHDAQVQLAINCSIKMGEKLSELNEQWKSDNLPVIKHRIAVHNGPAVVGYFGGRRRTDYTAIGSTINMAQRIENVTPPGDVYFSSTVRDLLPKDIKWEQVGVFEFKGISSKELLFKIAV